MEPIIPGSGSDNSQNHRVLNCIPSRDTQNDWTLANAAAAGVVAAGPIPSAKDLRESWWHVGNQEDTGSCVGWAAADSVVRWHLVKSGRLTPADFLSPRFIWMAAKESDEFVPRPTTFIEAAGTSLKAALDVARKFGVATVDLLPFQAGAHYSGEEKTFYTACAQLRIASYINLSRNPDGWRTWIATAGPVLARVEVDVTWDRAHDTAGLLDKFRPETQRGGHAVALVGYTPERFIVRNSWGTQWGDQGFAYASDVYVAAAFTEAYGVTV